MLFYLVAHSLFSPPRTSRHPFQSLNQSDSPLRVKNHWHWDESDLTRHYADSRAQRDLSWGPRLGWGSGCPGLCARPFSSTSGPRKTEESNSIPAPVLTAPPSAQRSWTDQPGCGEHCYLNSFLSLYAVLHGTTLKVSTVIFFKLFFLCPHRMLAEWLIEELHNCCAALHLLHIGKKYEKTENQSYLMEFKEQKKVEIVLLIQKPLV